MISPRGWEAGSRFLLYYRERHARQFHTQVMSYSPYGLLLWRVEYVGAHPGHLVYEFPVNSHTLHRPLPNQLLDARAPEYH